MDCHLFDLRYGTDTHLMVPKREMKVKSQHFKNSLMYMVSWTSVIIESLDFVKRELMTHESNYRFIDIGCGKGKVVLVARLQVFIDGDRSSYIGIDFDEKLIEIARDNSSHLFGDEGAFLHADIIDFDFKQLNSSLILFLYNPFDQDVLEKFLLKLKELSVIIIYVNPVHRHLLIGQGYISRTQNSDWHPNLTFEIFESPVC
jgi:SAM-dependent methyltransferase